MEEAGEAESEKMCEAAFEGELDEVKGWIEKGYDIESVDAHEHTPLSEAAAKGHIEVVEFLLDQVPIPMHAMTTDDHHFIVLHFMDT